MSLDRIDLSSGDLPIDASVMIAPDGQVADGDVGMTDADVGDGGPMGDAEVPPPMDGSMGPEAGVDVTVADAATAAGVDASVDASMDASLDAGTDAMVDSGVDCNPDPDLTVADADGDGILDVFDPDDDNDGILDVDECFASPPQLLANNGFEEPVIGTDWVHLDESAVPAWSTTAGDSLIEIWISGYNGVDAAEGQQFAECNANVPGALYQDVATEPGTTVRWAFYHRGRGGTDTIELKLGPPGATVTQGSFSTANSSWSLYAGRYVIPAGQTTTRFEYNCEAQTGTVGNLLDAAFMEPECTLDADNDGCPDIRDVN